MNGFRTRLRRLLALVICVLAAALPFSARARLGGLLSVLSRVGHPRESRLFRFQVTFWNHMVLGLVFFLGFPLARLFMPLWGPSRFSPPPGTPSYWLPRPDSREYDAAIEDPF